MAYFSTYYNDLKTLKEKIVNDIKNDDSDDARLTASLVNFKKEIEYLMETAAKNSWIEGKASQSPNNAEVHWWAGSGAKPE